ncbi:MAG: hypothetical protein ACRD17_10675 [Terriglobales bacterium]
MSSLLVVLTVFIAVTAIAVILQAIILLGLARAVGKLAQRGDKVLTQLESRLPRMLSESESLIRESRAKVDLAGNHVVEISALVRDQVQRADALLVDLTERARLQIIRLDETMSTTFDKVDETATLIQHSIIRPIRDTAAVIRGIRTGVDFFLHRRPSPPPALAPQDEEMFI